MQQLQNTLVLALAILLISSCKPKDEDPIAPPPPTNEEEVITSVTVTFSDPEIMDDVFVFKSQDLDGDGGNPPVVTTVPLPAGRALNMLVTFQNESSTPAVDVTGEIEGEASAHQVFFSTGDADMSILYGDQDGDGLPLGLVNVAITGAASSGTLTLTLRHDPDKNGPGVANGDITSAGGVTDVEVFFPLVIE